MSKYQAKNTIEVMVVNLHCSACDADFEVAPYYMPMEQKYDAGSCEMEYYYVCHCPYCLKKFMLRA